MVENKAFAKAMKKTAEFEGGYANAKTDTGGETFRGISRINNPKWAGWKLIDAFKKEAGGVKQVRRWWTNVDEYFKDNAEMDALVMECYEPKYWAPIEKMGMPDAATEKVFDFGVNAGPARAIMLTQRTLNKLAAMGLVEDGAFGPKTAAAIKKFFTDDSKTRAFLSKYRELQLIYYQDIVKRNPKQAANLPAWTTRANWIPTV